MNRVLPIFIFVFLISEFQVHAQIMKLQSVFQEVKANNSRLKVYDERISASDINASGVTAWEAPKVGASFWMMPYQFSNSGFLVFSAEQMFKNSQKTKARKNLMDGMSSIDQSEKKYTLNELLFQAQSDYYSCIILTKKLFLLDRIENVFQYIFKSAEMRYAYNGEKLSEIYKAKLDALEISVQKKNLLNQIKVKKIELNALMSRDVNVEFDVDTLYELNNYETILIDTAALKNRRSDLGLLDQKMKIAALSQKLEMSNAYPDYGLKYEHMNAFGGFPNAFSLMGSISIPMLPWVSKEYKAKSASYDYTIKSLQDEKKAMLSDAVSKATGLLITMNSLQEELAIYKKKIIPAAEDYYKVSMQAYEQNSDHIQSVLMSLVKWQSIQMDYLDKTGELLQVQTQYEKELEIKESN